MVGTVLMVVDSSLLLKRSACRRVFQVCGVRTMVAGAKSDSDRIICTMKCCSSMYNKVAGSSSAGRGGRECLIALGQFVSGWWFGGF